MVAPPQTTSVIVNNSDVIFDASSRCFIGTPVYATEPQSLMHRCNKLVDKTTRRRAHRKSIAYTRDFFRLNRSNTGIFNNAKPDASF
jgi:hypothetical protein